MDTALEAAKYGEIIGLDDDLKVYSGYDSYHYQENARLDPGTNLSGEPSPLLSKEHRLELADLMIARWTLYKESLE